MKSPNLYPYVDPVKLVDLLHSASLRDFLQSEAAQDERGRISRAQKTFGPMASFALEQLHVQRKAVVKAPLLYRSGWLFTQRSLEQCTSEAVARVKSRWLQGDRFTDLTTGAGVDAFFASRSGIPLSLAEHDPLLRAMLAYNFRGTGNLLNIEEDGMSYLKSISESAPMSGVHTPLMKTKAVDSSNPIDRHAIGSVAYLDPDRRPGGRRTASWQDSIPNIIAIMPQLCRSFDSVWVKSSPMTDPTASMRAWNGHTTDVFAICWQGELKEILFRVQKGTPGDCRLHAVYIHGHDPYDPIEALKGQNTGPMVQDIEPPPFHIFSRSLSEVKAAHSNASQARPGDLLFEPHAGLTRLNLSVEFALELGYTQLAPHVPYFLMGSNHSALRTDHMPGRILSIRDVLNYQPKTLVAQLKAMGVHRAMLASKCFYLNVAQLRSTLKIPDGEDAYLIFTTLSGNRAVCIVADLL